MKQNVFTKCDGIEIPGLLHRLSLVMPDHGLLASGLRVLKKPLSFYTDAQFYELMQADRHPPRVIEVILTPTLTFICNGDPTDLAAFHKVNPPVLNKHTILDYAQFYMSHITGPHGKNTLVDTVEELGLQEEPTPSMRKSLQDRIVPLAIHASLPGSGFQLRGTLLIGQTLYSVYLDIDSSGGIFPHIHKVIADLLPVVDRVLEA